MVVLPNSQEVQVEILFADFTAPLIVLLLVTEALGAVTGYVAPMVRRHRLASKPGQSCSTAPRRSTLAMLRRLSQEGDAWSPIERG